MSKKNQITTSSPRASDLSRKSKVVSRPGAALKVEVFKLTSEEKEGLTLKGRLSDIKIYSDVEWAKLKKLSAVGKR